MSDTKHKLPPFPHLPEGDKTTDLVGRIKSAISALPFYFDSATNIEGIEACDLFSLNSVLGATIEVQAVAALNKLRNIWDPDNEYSSYAFRRSSQSFPDVRLVDSTSSDSRPLLGIELKGWYLLTKEKVPTFRYRVTPDACSIFDLLVVIPWHLNNVLAGKPVIIDPFITNAKWAAEARNHYWSNLRDSSTDKKIISPEYVEPYPKASMEILDKPVKDGGGNFGRIARVPSLMDDYVESTLQTLIAGIPAKYWIDFFAAFVDSHTKEDIEKEIKEKIVNIVKEWNISKGSESKIEVLTDSIVGLLVAIRNSEA